jgi:glycosyltransferase involved in cell wall biosynthesis
VKTLLIEPYFGGSHQAWAEGYRSHSSHEVALLTLPARWWKWRMRGGAVTLAEQAAELASNGYRPDVVMVSSMIDLALLRTLLDGIWGRIPTVLYLHESQFTYPDSPQMEPDASYGYTNWTSALVADAVIFNSEHHRNVFFEAAWRMLRGMPDHRHEHLLDPVRAKTMVLPVGVDLSWVGERIVDEGPPLVLWNHRWEHDKDPEAFFAAVRRLAAEGVDFRLALCGESFRQVPTEFEHARHDLGDRIIHYGFADLDTYRAIIRAANVVVSTALQEFFGIAVVEAIAAGATPVLPNRLSYPELIPTEFHDRVLYDGDVTPALRTALASPPLALGAHVRRFDWSIVAPSYDETLRQLCPPRSGGRGPREERAG